MLVNKENIREIVQAALESGSFGAVYKVSKENKYFAAKVLSDNSC